MDKFSNILQNPAQLRTLTGLESDEFAALLTVFAAAVPLVMEHQRIDGRIRDGRSWAPYKNSPLPTAADKLLFILVYLRQNPIQSVQGQLFGMTQSNVSKWVRLTHAMLNVALHHAHALPYRTAESLQAYITTKYTDPTTAPLFIMTAPNARSAAP